MLCCVCQPPDRGIRCRSLDSAPEPCRPCVSATGRRSAVRSSKRRCTSSRNTGPAGLSVSAIGKQLGVSGPALYRYFASRDEMLTELVIDAYHDLADALRAAAAQRGRAGSARPVRGPRPRLPILGARPAAPVPAAVRAPAARLRRTRATTRRRLANRDEPAARVVLRELGDRPGRRPAPPAARLPAHGLGAGAHDPGVDPATALRAVLTWSRLHGLVSLEIAGNFASMGIDPDQVFEAQLTTL